VRYHALFLKPAYDTELATHRPANNVTFFIDIIVKVPAVQIVIMLHAFLLLALELPAPFFKGTGMYRSLPLRLVMLLGQAFLAILFYQVRRCHVKTHGCPNTD
jgi:hypothetical protein